MNGLQALQMLQGQRPPQPSAHTVLIVDINMPLLDGIELLREVRENEQWQDTPAYVLTTSEHEPDLEDANSLAILWSVGVNYIRGYFIQEPSPTVNYDFDSESTAH